MQVQILSRVWMPCCVSAGVDNEACCWEGNANHVSAWMPCYSFGKPARAAGEVGGERAGPNGGGAPGSGDEEERRRSSLTFQNGLLTTQDIFVPLA